MARWLLAVVLLAIASGIAWWQVRAQAREDLLFPQGTYAYLQDEPVELFRTSAAVPSRALAGQPVAVRGSHPIRFSRDAARSAAARGTVAVVLPDNTRYDVRFEREVRERTGDWTFIGRVTTPFGELASVLTFGADGVFGTLPAPDGRMFHVTTSHGTSTIAPATGMVPPGADPGAMASDTLVVPPMPGGEPRVAASASVLARADTTELQYIDVLGIYTADLVSLRGSASAAETEFTNLLAIANQAHVDSGTVARFRFARLVLSDYPAGEWNSSALDALTRNAMPDAMDVHAIRREVAADLVAMLRPYQDGDSSCGIAWLNGSNLRPDAASAEFAFSVSNVQPCGPLVLAHEMAHTLGSTHDAPNANAPGAFTFSMGYRQDGPPGFATVLAYARGEPWIGRFSDPLAQDCDASCGDDSTDNVRSLNLMAPRAAAFVNPPGTIVIDDGHVVEGNEDTYLLARMRLSEPAGPGGVRLAVAARDGTARAGTDYDAHPDPVLIPEGASEASVLIEILGDREQEAEESFRLVLEDVEGVAVHRGEARVVIVDDDPRATVHGRLQFPGGNPGPDGLEVGFRDNTSFLMLDEVRATGPDYDFSIDVVAGTDVVIELEPQSGYAGQVIYLGPVLADVERNLVVGAPLAVTGKLVFPEGLDPPGAADVIVSQQGESGSFGYYFEARAPEFEFELEGFNAGAEVFVEVRPPRPFYSVRHALGRIDADVHRVIEVPMTPEVAQIDGDGWSLEGNEGSSGSGVSVRLSGRAPEGGVTVLIKAVDDTATQGEDYVAFSSVVSIPAGSTIGFSAEPLMFIGDDVPEGNETVRLVAVSGTAVRLVDGMYGLRTIRDDDLAGRAPLDIDGDGASDLAWHSRMEEKLSWRPLGATSGSHERYVGKHYGIAAVADLDGNGEPDVLWQDDAGTDLAFWQRYFGEIETSYPVHPGPAWRAIGTADVTGTGQSHPLWHDPVRAKLRIQPPGAEAHDFDVPAGLRIAATGDFDGDRREDLVWRGEASDALWLWRARGGFEFEAAERLDLDAAGGTVFGAADIDGDGRDELLWHGGPLGELRWWTVPSPGPAPTGTLPLPPDYRLVAIGDYNADGRSDFVWRNSGRTRLLLWRATNNGFSEQAVGAHPGGDWAPATVEFPDAVSGAGGNGGAMSVVDVDGDGRNELLWHDPASGQLDWWRVRNGRRVGLLGGKAPGMDLVATGRFDGSVGADVLWRDHEDTLWLGSVAAPGGPRQRLPREAGKDWHAIGVADTDGDGRDEILWQDRAGRQLRWWSMAGAGMPEESAIALPPGSTLVAVADFDGNGRSDLVWHDAGRGELVLWRFREGGLEKSTIAAWAGKASMRIDAGDVDGDGRADLVWHDRATGSVEWWRMAGAKRVARRSGSVAAGSSLMGLSDLDGDGSAELVWHDRARGSLVSWRWSLEQLVEARFADFPGYPVEPPPMVAGPHGR